MPNPIGHFEFLVNDVDRAKEFYGKVFDWTYEDVPGYTMIDAGVDPRGGMMKKPDQAPHPSLNVYFVVKDVDDTLEKVQAAGGCVILGKTEIEVGWWAMFMDPDNIPVGIFQPKA
jgi:predicted enzyme related to lactoylglutathione lyase